MSKNEIMISAMIENAKSSTWRENLDNAFEAQEHFMLGSHDRQEPKFLKRLRERSNTMRRSEENHRLAAVE